MKASMTVKATLSLVLPLILGAVAGAITGPAIDGWYVHLTKPSFSPPNWIFGPVWTLLYLLMGYSLFRIWRLPATDMRNRALLLFALQLALNIAWSFLFFGLRNPALALGEILVLWVAVAYMLHFFYRIDPPAAWINLPYFGWLSFAVVLNAAYAWLNVWGA
ncbi:MAG: hypothetical protein CV087_24120 [Candidatus Brocadia sp. WS118]|nr:tryptophan-rich sensory protein [Saprospiraceae bacterium]TVL95801.1 MAG: hypothetical protein CV087_24120 [Candidatus Brocadia sp. WS118]